MNRGFLVRLTCTLTICILLAVTGEAPAPWARPAASLRQGAVLQQWLSRRPWLREATDRDCVNKDGLDSMRQEHGLNYQPYAVGGDFNGDGYEDFAVALVDSRRRTRRFAIAVFNGPFRRDGANQPAFYREGVDLSTGGLVFGTDGRLLAGVFYTDDCVVLRPRGRGYVMVNCL